MIQHQTEIFLLFYDLMSLLVEDVAKTVKCLVELTAPYTLLVKPEVQFLVLEGVQHIRHLAPHLS